MRLLCGEWENVRERFPTWLWFVYRLSPNDHQRSWKNSRWPGLLVDLRDQVSAAAQNAIGNLEQTHKGAATFCYCFWHLVIVFFLVLTLSILHNIKHDIKSSESECLDFFASSTFCMQWYENRVVTNEIMKKHQIWASPSTQPVSVLVMLIRLVVGWSLSQHALEERQGALWTVHQSIT